AVLRRRAHPDRSRDGALARAGRDGRQPDARGSGARSSARRSVTDDVKPSEDEVSPYFPLVIPRAGRPRNLFSVGGPEQILRFAQDDKRARAARWKRLFLIVA